VSVAARSEIVRPMGRFQRITTLYTFLVSHELNTTL
jgi:hypothetical protein